MASVDCVTEIGFASAAAPTAWAGKEPSRKLADWLPKIEEPFLDTRTGRVSTRWYNFFRELGDRVGGIKGPSITQVVDTVSQTQNQVAANTTYTQQAVDYAASVAATAEATAQVAQSNGLSGSGSIPPPSRPPSRPNYVLE
jgi:hypothetical protein